MFGARLRITTLRGPAGQGIELLEYLAPRDGRPAPSDSRSNDLAHWRTTLEATDVDAMYRHVRGSACVAISPGVIAPEERAVGFRKALRLADPDAHELLLME